MNCQECKYLVLNKTNGHCYMFEDKPEDNYCAQETPTTDYFELANNLICLERGGYKRCELTLFVAGENLGKTVFRG